MRVMAAASVRTRTPHATRTVCLGAQRLLPPLRVSLLRQPQQDSTEQGHLLPPLLLPLARLVVHPRPGLERVLEGVGPVCEGKRVPLV